MNHPVPTPALNLGPWTLRNKAMVRDRREVAHVMKRFLSSICLSVYCAAALCTPVNSSVRGEIELLLAKLQTSGCEFNRNGVWYSGAEAKAHLLRKLDYFENKGELQSTEQFIQMAASSSSMTGQSYQVKCAAESPLKSQVWLSKELSSIRKVVHSKP